jgi:hypothetical protein
VEHVFKVIFELDDQILTRNGIQSQYLGGGDARTSQPPTRKPASRNQELFVYKFNECPGLLTSSYMLVLTPFMRKLNWLLCSFFEVDKLVQ